jgi:hypothetical protein
MLSYDPAAASTRPHHYSGIQVRICQVAHRKVIHRTRFTRVVGGPVCHNAACEDGCGMCQLQSAQNLPVALHHIIRPD